MAQQTAVEWLANELHVFIHPEHGKDFLPILKQAKAMEKQQIEQAFIDGDCGYHPDNGTQERMAKEYYNEKYGNL